MGKQVEAMTKAQLITHLKACGASALSRAALDARPVGQLREMALKDRRERNGGS